MDGWIKLHRKLQKWEWYNDSKMVHLLIHLILSANHKADKWRGIKIEKGQLITGRKQLNKETGISEQSIRTCLDRMESTNEILIKSTNKYSIITICNYDIYQLIKINTNQQSTNNQPTINQQSTTNKKDKNEKNKEVYNSFLLETDDLKYHAFVAFLFGDNEVKTPFEKCLSMNNQITPANFRTLMNKYPKDLIKLKINAMENKKDLLKRYSSFYRTLNNWCLKG